MRTARRLRAMLAVLTLVGASTIVGGAPALGRPDGGTAGRATAAGRADLPALRRAAPGTSATIRFTDAPALTAGAMSPHLRDIVSAAKRVRTVDVGASALDTGLTAARVSLELFADVAVPLDTTVALSAGAAVKGMPSMMYSAGGDSAAALVTIINGEVRAAVWVGATRYGIEPLGNGRHLVFQDGRSYPGEDGPHLEQHGDDNGRPPAAGAAPAAAAATAVIDVMVAFDDSAQTWYGSADAARADIIAMINLSNLTYANSQIDQRLALASILDLNHTPNAADGTVDGYKYIAAIRSKSDGIVDDIHTARNASGADLVSVVSSLTAFCGLGYLPTSSNPAEFDAYSLVDSGCAVGNLTFPHELGHNMCANHDQPNASSNSCPPDAFGHFSVADRLRTIMSYANTVNGCTGCTRIPYFSNPNVRYQGWVTGIPGAQDNSRAIAQRAATISSYRAAPLA